MYTLTVKPKTNHDIEGSILHYMLAFILPSLAFAQSPTQLHPSLGIPSAESISVQLPFPLVEVLVVQAKCSLEAAKQCANCCKSVPIPATPVSAKDQKEMVKTFALKDRSTQALVTAGPKFEARSETNAPSDAIQAQIVDIVSVMSANNPIAECLRKCPEH